MPTCSDRGIKLTHLAPFRQYHLWRIKNPKTMILALYQNTSLQIWWNLWFITLYLIPSPSKVVGKGRHMFFLPLLFGTHFVKILSWKNFWFPKFPFLGIGLGLYHVGPHQVEFLSLKPLEPESILSKWSKSLYSGQESKPSSWGPGFGPRLKLYMVFNTPRWVGLVRVLNRKSAKNFGGLFSPVLVIRSLKWEMYSPVIFLRPSQIFPFKAKETRF